MFIPHKRLLADAGAEGKCTRDVRQTRLRAVICTPLMRERLKTENAGWYGSIPLYRKTIGVSETNRTTTCTVVALDDHGSSGPDTWDETSEE
ncbi:hypothetical protein EVAR_83128_1 [Eumeta japonica]|uniref:Uncharacterized protein n=1 Tax=Eumeta variegata TaxID=151549 RepID=A0A4C1Y9K6_EUMVA|nr:hypothetical protein EVAR_83128_1 [Eumeta japonica]